MKARQTVIDGAARPEDAKRLLAAFDIAWKVIAPRVADNAAVSDNLARRLVSIGNYRPDLPPADLAKMVSRMFDARSDREVMKKTLGGTSTEARLESDVVSSPQTSIYALSIRGASARSIREPATRSEKRTIAVLGCGNEVQNS